MFVFVAIVGIIQRCSPEEREHITLQGFSRTCGSYCFVCPVSFLISSSNNRAYLHLWCRGLSCLNFPPLGARVPQGGPESLLHSHPGWLCLLLPTEPTSLLEAGGRGNAWKPVGPNLRCLAPGFTNIKYLIIKFKFYNLNIKFFLFTCVFLQLDHDFFLGEDVNLYL